jgi:hypothetical protein
MACAVIARMGVASAFGTLTEVWEKVSAIGNQAHWSVVLKSHAVAAQEELKH